MLTQNISQNYQTIYPLKNIVLAEIAKYFWNASFKTKYFVNLSVCELISHRKKTIAISNNFVKENKLPFLFQTLFTESINLLHKALYQLFLWKKTYDAKDYIDLFQVGELHAPNYFTIGGEFHDFMWAKRYVNNAQTDMYRRFCLACVYWFNDVTWILWSEMHTSHSIPVCELGLALQGKIDPLVQLRIFELENKLQVLQSFSEYSDSNFWEVVLMKSIKNGYEYAVYFLWGIFTEAQKSRFIENNILFELITHFTEYPKNKICYFLYLQLSYKQKQHLLDWTSSYRDPGIWFNLLLYPSSQTFRREIIEFTYKLPIEIYSKLLELLASRIRIREFEYLLEKKLFNVLWSNLTSEQKRYPLERTKILEYLLAEDSFYNIGYIIKGLSLEQKENGLFAGWYNIRRCLYYLFFPEDIDLLQNFLSFFLIELDPYTQRESLRKDAISFLQKLADPASLKEYKGDYKLFDGNLAKIRSLICTFQTNLILLDELCFKVCNEVSIAPDFN